MSDQINTPLTVLVIGDWVVDDNWVIGPHTSVLSSSAGRQHFASLHHAGSTVRMACAAGRVGSFLHSADWASLGLECRIRGLGVWHPEDTFYLRGMFDPARMSGSNPYRVVGQTNVDEVYPSVELYNFGKCLELFGITHHHTDEVGRAEDGEYYGTTRVYRVFRKTGDRAEQLSRVDWELPSRYLDGNDASWLPPTTGEGHERWNKTPRPEVQADYQTHAKTIELQGKTIRERIVSWLREVVDGVDAVIVKDNGKGVMTTNVIHLLLEARDGLRQKPWFVDTKKWQPNWLTALVRAGANLRVTVFQGEATTQCRKVNTWVSKSKYVTGEAIAELGRWQTELREGLSGLKPARRLTLLLPNGFSALGQVSESADMADSLLLQPDVNTHKVEMATSVGLASAVVTTLAYGLLGEEQMPGWKQAELNQEEKTQEGQFRGHPDRLFNTESLVDGALRFAQHWVKTSYDHIRHPRTASPVPDPILTIQQPSTADGEATRRILALGQRERDGKPIKPVKMDGVGNVSAVGADGRLQDPNQTTDPFQAIFEETQRGDGRTEVALNVNRGCIELPKYVCCVPSKRDVIATLIRQFREFNPREARHAAAGLLLARSGAGKSTLVERLAEALDYRLLTINITNLNRREDLLAEFDRIVTDQAELSAAERMLVFVDEVNAHVEGGPVYDAFLTPLENGYYVRGGHRFHIDPCLWLFVGTADEPAVRAQTKGSDFLSRMTFDTLDMRGEADLPVYALQENLLVGAALAVSRYSQLDRLHRQVVQDLAGLPATTSVRDIKHLIETNLDIDRAGSGRWRNAVKVSAWRSRNSAGTSTAQSERWVQLEQGLKDYLNGRGCEWVRIRATDNDPRAGAPARQPTPPRPTTNAVPVVTPPI